MAPIPISSRFPPHFGFILVQWLAVLALAAVGFWAALDVGISWDEESEALTLAINIKAIAGLLNGNTAPYALLEQFHDRYYGVGFQLPAWALLQVMGSIFPRSWLVPLSFQSPAHTLIPLHLLVFLLFLLSGYLVKWSVALLTGDRYLPFLAMLAYLLWPYLFGHALINVKDIPFLFAWLLCTYLVLRLGHLMLAGGAHKPRDANHLTWRQGLMLGLATGWLISIRISGVLIALEYIVFILAYAWVLKVSWRSVSPVFGLLRFSLLVLVTACLTLYLLYPIAWANPLEVLKAVQYMSAHPWQGSTLTAGQWIEPKTRLYWYLPAWLLVKLPVIILLGLLLSPWALVARWKFVHNQVDVVLRRTECFCVTTWLAIAGTVLVIVCALVLKQVALYNELRQVLFLLPLCFIFGVVSLFYCFRPLALGALVVSVGLSVWDNPRLHPFEYVYFNGLARQLPVVQQYESDYYALSVAQLSRRFNRDARDFGSMCLFVPSLHLWQYELDQNRFGCVAPYPGDLSLLPRPYLFFVVNRNAMPFSPPAGCEVLYREERSLALSPFTIPMGTVYFCPRVKFIK